MNTRMSRRQWLKAGSLAAAGIAVAPAPSGWVVPNARPMVSPIRLHSNENPYGPSPAARQAIQSAFDLGNRYIYETNTLRKLIAEREGLTMEHVVLGAGSHEVLRMAAMAYGLEGGELLIGYPTFEGLERYARSIKANVNRVPLDDALQFDLSAMDRQATASIDLVYLCNPNNPTSTLTPGRPLQDFCNEVASRSVVFVDEAYHEFVEDPSYLSMVSLVKENKDVIVSRTFSKIFGLAGLRIGYALARPEIARRLRNFATNMGRNVLGMHAAIASYQDLEFIKFSRVKNKEARVFTVQVLKDMGHRCLPTDTNFLFFELGQEIQPFRAKMEQRGVLVGRPFPPYTRWCRLSIGTLDEMSVFAEAFREVMS